MHISEARSLCEQFALDHKLIFVEDGEIGFERPCVGFLARNGSYVAYNPTRVEQGIHDINPTKYGIKVEKFYFEGMDTSPPEESPDAYHKDDYMAILGHGDEAIIQLARWVEHLNSQGEVFVDSYEKGYKGLQAVFNPDPQYGVGIR